MPQGGSGSQLVIKAREASARAKAADALGVTGPSKIGGGRENPMQGMVEHAQPTQPASTDVPFRKRMLAEVETFLASLGASKGS